MASGWFRARYRFHCDECDGDIARNEAYIEFMGMNFCESCFEGHKFDIEEEGESYMCECCGKMMTDGEYFKIDDDIFCLDCVESNSRETTQDIEDENERIDRKYDESI